MLKKNYSGKSQEKGKSQEMAAEPPLSGTAPLTSASQWLPDFEVCRTVTEIWGFNSHYQLFILPNRSCIKTNKTPHTLRII